MASTDSIVPDKAWTPERFERVLRDRKLHATPMTSDDGEVIGYAVNSEDWLAFFLGGTEGVVDSLWLQAKVADTASLDAVERCNRDTRFVRVVLLGECAEAWMDVWLGGLREEGLGPNIQIWQQHLKQTRAQFASALGHAVGSEVPGPSNSAETL